MRPVELQSAIIQLAELELEPLREANVCLTHAAAAWIETFQGNVEANSHTPGEECLLHHRFQLSEALDAALPANTPPELVRRLHDQLDALFAEAPRARPLELGGDLRLTAEDALVLLTTALKSQASGCSHRAQETQEPSTKRVEDPDGSLRKKIDDAVKANDDDVWSEIAKDKNALALMTPEEKAMAIRGLKDGYTGDAEDRQILDVMMSCTSREEFDEVIQKAGGTAVLTEMDHGDTINKTAMLFAMWDRADLIPPGNAYLQDLASKVEHGVLMRPDGGGLASRGSAPTIVDRHNQLYGDGADAVEGSSYDKHLYGEMHQGTRIELMMENSLRKADGKPPLDHNAMLGELREVMEDPALSKEQREAKIEQIRQQYGLSPDTMRELGTGFFATATAAVKQDVTAYYAEHIGMLSSAYEQAVLRYGADSPQALELERQLKDAEVEANQRIGKLQARQNELSELYKIKDFWDMLGSFFSDLVGVFGKVLDFVSPLLNAIPGIGQVAFATYTGLKVGIAAARGDLAGVLGGMANFAGPLGASIGGPLGKAAIQITEAGVTIGRGVAAAARGDWMGMLGAVGGGLNSAGVSLPLPEGLNKGTALFSDVSGVVEGIASGSFEQVLKGLGDAVDFLPDSVRAALSGEETFRKALEYSKTGAQLFQSLNNGNWASALGIMHQQLSGPLGSFDGGQLGRFVEDATSALNHPAVRQLFSDFESVEPFVTSVISGDYRSSLQSLLDSPEWNPLHAPVTRLLKSVDQFEPAFQQIAAQVLAQFPSPWVSSAGMR